MSFAVFDKKESAAHFMALFEHAPTGIVITDNTGRIIAANPYSFRAFGYSETEFKSRYVDHLIPARFRKKYAGFYRRYFNRVGGQGTITRELLALKRDGTEFPIEISISTYYFNRDMFGVVFIDDISRRKKAEEKIKRLNSELGETVKRRTEQLAHIILQLEDKMAEVNAADDQLQETNRYLHSILNHAGAMITAVDVNGVIRLFNPNIEQTLGYAAEEIIGLESPILFCDKGLIEKRKQELSPDMKALITTDLDIFTFRARMNIVDTQEWIYVKKDGTRFPVSLTITALRDETDEITGFMGIAFDISERKKAEQDLVVALEREKELNELKSRFISMASHEFRTPLSTILSSAYLIGKYVNTEDQPKRELHLQRVVSSVSTLTDTLNDFLSVGKIEEGKIQARMAEFDIFESVQSLVRELENSLRKGQRVTYAHEGPALVKLDWSLLKRILMNLLSNASKFSYEGSSIDVSTKAANGKFVLSVKDDGIGISAEDKAHLTERFFRGSNAANIQGTGLGLHIVAKYAEMMDGFVECKSELLKGTEFTVILNKKAG